MTLKHTNFEDSTTMRSLVKVAKEKGWIKDEPLTKTASAPELDLTPSANLMENIIKLCSGLRASGFKKQADEIETKFLQLKQANALYDVSNEKGEDLVHAAHPKGSHKMEDIDSKEATFEDILDKHMKHLEVANSKPTGKYSSSQDLLKAVKRVLANAKVVTAAPSLDELYEQANTVFQKFKQIYSNIALQNGGDVSVNQEYFGALQHDIDNRKVYQSRDLENSLINSVEWFKDQEAPNWFSSGDENQKWQDVILPMLGIANRYANQFQSIVSQIRKIETAAKTQQTIKQYDPDAQPGPEPKPEASEPESPLHPYFQQIDALQQKVKSWLAIRSIARNAAAAKWIQDEFNTLQDIVDRYAQVNPAQQANLANEMKQELANESRDIDTFENQWVKARG